MSDAEQRDAATISGFIVEAIGRRLPDTAGRELDVDAPFSELGLDSVALSDVAGDVEELLGTALSETLLFEAPTIRRLAELLAGSSPDPAADGQRSRGGLEPIAVIGMSCRFPGAPDTSSFWRMVLAGDEAVSLEPPERAALRNHDSGLRRWGGYLDGIDQFDAEFFNITPREAALVDPQQRLFLEVAWDAFEDAGLPTDRLRGQRVGVFVGVGSHDYGSLVAASDAGLDIHAATGNSLSIVANRLSYLLDLRGPSVAVDTACSASLVAVHLACQSLVSGDADLAIAGGVNVVLLPLVHDAFTKAGVMAADGRCKAFRADADGYVRGEGCGAVVLKRWSDVLASDRVLALIHGSAVNQDGSTNGLTAPNGAAQRDVIRRALDRAEVRPAEVGFVEAHGTGTILGDPIEVGALAHEYGTAGRAVPCRLGSVKANIGHLESAAGIAGLVKVVLALRHRTIPPQPDPALLNPRLDLADGSLEVSFDAVSWPHDAPLAGVSSFGFGGTNAHVVVGPAPELATRAHGPDRGWHVAAISARTPSALVAAAAAASRVDGAVGDVCHTLNTSRTAFDHRVAIVAPDLPTLRVRLRAWAGGAAMTTRSDRGRSRPLRPVFLFAGQGSQHAGMARGLYESSPTFRTLVDRCDPVVRDLTGWGVSDVVLAGESDPVAAELGARSELAQPVLVAVECALAQLWQSWGVTPSAVIGHSLGEYSASVVAGAHDIDDVLRLVARRGRLFDELDVDGGLLAVFAEADLVEGHVAQWVDAEIVGRNSRRQTLVAAPTETLEEVAASLDTVGVSWRRISNPPAHSSMLAPMSAAFAALAADVPTAPMQIPFVAAVNPRRFEVGEMLPPRHWAVHLRQPIDFPAACALVDSSDGVAFIEIGPGAHLTSLAREIVGDGSLYLPSLDGSDDCDTIATSVAALWAAGGMVDWRSFDAPYDRQRVDAPGYPFERRRHWIDLPDGRPRVEAAIAAAVPASSRPVGRSPIEELRTLVAEVAGLDVAHVSPQTSLLELGLDSVLVVELRNRMEECFSGDVPPLSTFMDGASLEALVGGATLGDQEPPVDAGPDPEAELGAPIDDLDDHELVRQLIAAAWVDDDVE